jgi:putative membrane-bound dehydrogenase-like protein
VSREEWQKAPPTPHAAAKAARASAEREGAVPVGADGKPLNLGFETGTLEDWKAEGAAFEGQPIRGDTVSRRRGDMRSQHIGEYWIGTYEISGDDAQGTLTSVPFKVTHPYASFLVAGGPHANTRVELARVDEEKSFFSISGSESENLRPVVIDLKAHQDREILIRIVDQQGGHWGHINFDDFRFHAERPELPNALDSNQVARQEVPPPDVVEHAGLTPEEAVKAMTLPEGFSATAFAAEPDVQQPIAMALDDRGRLWIAEAYNYPVRAPEGQGKDRILILEDTDGDGAFDERTVFIENLNLVSGMELGFGGVWVGAAPYLMFIPDRDGDDRPDGEPVILLDGWAWQDTHETLNTFIWGPDGWLYGCHGVFTHSNVGKPGAPDSERQRINAGIWRYHPTRHEFEVFAEGTSNPWGIDFNDYGQCFIEACVIPHFFHVIQGARYHRQAGQHFNPFVYGDIKTIADHVHWAGSRGPHAGNARSDAAGGGHAHAGLMVYLGDSWPEAYRGEVFMNNIHGQRLNRDTVRRQGSGYVAEHAPDFLNFNDAWSQVLNFQYDQNGSIYIIDWYDQNQCHHNDPDGHDRSNGRIFKVVYDNEPWTPVNLRRKSDEELVRLQLHRNDWHVRHARRLLQERAADRGIDAAAQRLLTGLLTGGVNLEPDSSMRSPGEPAAKLRLMWAKHLTGGISEAEGGRLLGDSSEYVRGWTIQLLCERGNPSDALLEEFARMAREDESPLVRLYLAAAMQRSPVGKRLPVLEGLLAHADDAGDHNLPLMYWYALEPVVGAQPGQAIGLLAKSKIPVVREYITRRMTAASQETAWR